MSGPCAWTPAVEPCGAERVSWQHLRCADSEPEPCPDPCSPMAGCHPFTDAPAQPTASVPTLTAERLAAAIAEADGQPIEYLTKFPKLAEANREYAEALIAALACGGHR